MERNRIRGPWASKGAGRLSLAGFRLVRWPGRTTDNLGSFVIDLAAMSQPDTEFPLNSILLRHQRHEGRSVRYADKRDQPSRAQAARGGGNAGHGGFVSR
jgi:hypothetical protein